MRASESDCEVIITKCMLPPPISGQAGAARLAISRALLSFSDSFAEPLQNGKRDRFSKLVISNFLWFLFFFYCASTVSTAVFYFPTVFSTWRGIEEVQTVSCSDRICAHFIVQFQFVVFLFFVCKLQ